MKITFLGTGTSGGVPMVGCHCAICGSADSKDKRLRTSAMVQIDDKTIVIDSGPDFRQQMLRERVDRVDAILYTHAHMDHIGGLDDIRAYNYFLKKEMDLYLDDRTELGIRRFFGYIFDPNPYPGTPRVKLHHINNQPFDIEGLPITPIEVMHYQLPVLGFRIGDFTYITDANYISPVEKEKIKGSKVLVLNALRREKHISHFTLNEALATIAELQPEKAYLTHISHQMGLHTEVEKELPPNVHLAYDGLQLDVTF